MVNKLKFYICRHCGNIIVKLEDSGVPVVCCGEPMQELIPGTIDATVEKHIPTIEIKDDQVIVRVGEIPHPMIPEHYISWILIVTESGYQIKYTKTLEEASVVFKTTEKVLAAYEYCNLHGLWKKELD